MTTLMMAGFTVIPYLSPYFVKNAGIKESDLSTLYFVAGAVNFFMARWIGRMSDRLGKSKMFTVMALFSVATIYLLTTMPPWPLVAATAVMTVFTVSMTGRFVPAMAMITSSVRAESRGSFMSLSTSVQQAGTGIAAYVGGMMLTEAGGRIVHYDRVGLLAIAATLISIPLAQGLRREG